MTDLTNKVLFITGSLVGLGKAVAVAAAQAGATLVVAGGSHHQYQQVRPQLDAYGQQSLFVPLDMASARSMQKAIVAVEQQVGRFDIALNCDAGTEPFPHAQRLGGAKRPHRGTNPMDLFHCLNYEVEHFLQQGQGTIVNLTTPVNLTTSEGGPIPSAAIQHDLRSLACIIAWQCSEQHVRINTLSPYYASPRPPSRVDDDRADAAHPAAVAEVIRAFLYLVSEQGQHCHGIHWAIPF